MERKRPSGARLRPLARLAAMLRSKPILAAFCALAVAGLSACGGDKEIEPSIPLEDAQTLAGTLEEVQANVDEQSCFVAQDKVQELQDEIVGLPADANDEVVDALQEGAQNLGGLVESQCEEQEPEPTTTEETTTEETTTEETTTEDTQPTETQTQPPTQPGPPTNPGGGVGPGSGGL